MKMTTAILLLIMVNLSACENILLGEEEKNDPVTSFELFWNDFDKHYSLFHVRKLNWDSIYNVYRPQVTEGTLEPQLRNIFSAMITYLDDSHTALYGRGDTWGFTSGFALGEKAIKEEFSFSLLQSKYVESLSSVKGEGDLRFGKVKGKEIGYIFLRVMEGESPERAITTIVREFRDYKAIIVDVRTNDGGSGSYAKTIAGAFADGEHFISTVQTRNGPEHTDFDSPAKEFTQLTGEVQFLKPVIVLTDRATISAGDYFALCMTQFDHVTMIGDSTAGDFSSKSRRRFLPNGWSFHYSIQMRLLPDGRSIDGIGIVPDVYVKNSKNDIHSLNDRVFDTALNFLKERYGID
jgi:hypothetical protein